MAEVDQRHPTPFLAGREWLETVNRAETEAELAALRRSVTRGAPFGDTAWQERTAKRLGLESTLRARRRPSKKEERQRSKWNSPFG